MTKKELCEKLWRLNECAKQLAEETKAIIISMAAQEDEECHENQNSKDSKDNKDSRDKGKEEIYRPKPIKVLDDPENKHRWKYECPFCKKFTAEYVKDIGVSCGECGHFASYYGWYEGIGFEVVPTDENTIWPEKPKFNYEKSQTPIESAIKIMKQQEQKK